MTLLTIETSTSCCSAAITIDGRAVATRANMTNANHASELPVFVEQLLAEARANQWQIEAVALSQGPGSYTGLRIGTSLAKGICYGMNIPLIPIDTLQVLCAAALPTIQNDLATEPSAILCPMIDARRMEVYTSFYTREGVRKEEVMAKIVDQTFLEGLTNEPIYFFGNGSEKCKEIIILDNAHFIDSIVPEAKYMDRLVEKSAQLDIKQLAYYEPFYLKEFVAAPSHIKGLK
jgi:tRNA threonylcarbamoyladenosine biosynthesis protein TsaB